MAYTKTVWTNSNLPGISADNLNHIEEGIEAAHESIDNDLSNLSIYSFSETKSGKIWVDGRDIYRKVYFVANLPNAGSLYIDTEVSNIDFAFDVYGPASTNVPINSARPDGNELEISAWYEKSSNQLRVVTGNNRSGSSAYIIFEYLKITNEVEVNNE